MGFHQVYEPVAGNLVLSALVAGIPLYVLFLLLAVFKRPAWICALAAMLSAALVAFVGWGMPAPLVASATTNGMAFGLWPISWIVLNAVFFHNLTIASGDFDVIRRSLARLTEDRRIQALLVAFCFGALLEGVAGFGAPVAITAAILAGLGFEPITAAVLALLANTAPVAFGSIGIPVVTLGGLTATIIGHSAADTDRVTLAISAMVGRQLPLFSILVPALLVTVLAGWRRMLQVLPAVATAGITFAVVQFLVSNFIGPQLTDILAALAAMGALALLLTVWRPRETFRFAGDDREPRTGQPAAPPGAPRRVLGGAGERALVEIVDSRSRIARAYAMYLVLVVVILVGQMGNLPFWAGSPAGDPATSLRTPYNVTADLKCGSTAAYKLCPLPWLGANPKTDPQGFRLPYWSFQWPGSYTTGAAGKIKPTITREPPIVSKETAYPLTFNWDFLAAAGTLVLLAAIAAFIVMMIGGLSPLTFFTTYAATVRQLALPIFTIACILAVAVVMNYSGMTSTLAIVMAKTGPAFPFFSAVIGMLGVFLTGSDTSSNTLFGPMQAITAHQAGLNPVLTTATNSSGGVMGKMISPQNLSVGAAGVNQVGAEGAIFRRVVGYSLVLTALVGLLAMFQAYVVPWVVPVVGR
jgi:L-lactate permease